MATMEEKRAMAKAEGYTDAEIDNFLSGQSAGSDERTGGPSMGERALGLLPAAGGLAGGLAGGAGGTVFGMGFGGVPGAIGGSTLGTAGGEAIRQLIARRLGYEAPETPGEAAGQIGLEGAIGGATAGVAGGIGKLASAAGKAAPRLGGAIGKVFARRIPILGDAMDIGEIAAAAGKGEGKAAASSAAKPAVERASEAGRELASHRWSKPAPKAGTAESRISKPKLEVVEGKGPRTKPHRPRGKSGPALDETAAARRQAVGKDPAMGDAGLGGQLEQSAVMESQMKRLGWSDEQRQMMRQLARKGVTIEQVLSQIGG